MLVHPCSQNVTQNRNALFKIIHTWNKNVLSWFYLEKKIIWCLQKDINYEDRCTHVTEHFRQMPNVASSTTTKLLLTPDGAPVFLSRVTNNNARNKCMPNPLSKHTTRLMEGGKQWARFKVKFCLLHFFFFIVLLPRKWFPSQASNNSVGKQVCRHRKQQVSIFFMFVH